MIDNPAVEWGIHIDRVEIKDVALPETMKRSMSRQAEAERERRARIITADGELQASEKLAQAAAMMADTPPRCNCGCCRPSSRSPPRRTRPWCCPSRSSCCDSWRTPSLGVSHFRSSGSYGQGQRRRRQSLARCQGKARQCSSGSRPGGSGTRECGSAGCPRRQSPQPTPAAPFSRPERLLIRSR